MYVVWFALVLVLVLVLVHSDDVVRKLHSDAGQPTRHKHGLFAHPTGGCRCLGLEIRGSGWMGVLLDMERRRRRRRG